MNKKEVVLLLDDIRNDLRSMQTDLEFIDKKLGEIEKYFEG